MLLLLQTAADQGVNLLGVRGNKLALRTLSKPTITQNTDIYTKQIVVRHHHTEDVKTLHFSLRFTSLTQIEKHHSLKTDASSAMRTHTYNSNNRATNYYHTDETINIDIQYAWSIYKRVFCENHKGREVTK